MNDAKLEALIKGHEGFRPKAYKDSLGYLTVGWGHKLSREISAWLRPGMPVKQEVLDAYFREDLKEARRCVAALCIEGLDEVREAVLIDMAFNLGCAGLRKFKKMLAAIETKNFDLAAQEMMKSVWASQVKSRAVQLSMMMETGEWPKGL